MRFTGELRDYGGVGDILIANDVCMRGGGIVAFDAKVYLPSRAVHSGLGLYLH